MAQLFADYKRVTKGLKISFRDYLQIIEFEDPEKPLRGRDEGRGLSVGPGFELVMVPKKPVTGDLRLIVLLVDFEDNVGRRPPQEYDDMLFSENVFLTGSLRDFYRQVTRGQVDVTGTVHGWLRMPKPYGFYVNNQSGTGAYPNNAQMLAEHALAAAIRDQVEFSPALDKFQDQSITGLFLVHAGRGAEGVPNTMLRKQHIWSHKADLARPVEVRDGLFATTYLTVPEDCKMGVCAHELGHLAFQWDDFYDPNYGRDGNEWDGSGNWDLMAGGSWNDGGNTPAHPAGLHKSQHGWVPVNRITTTTRGLVIPPLSNPDGAIVSIRSSVFKNTQSLILENRVRAGFDAKLPGTGLLVWRVDTDLQQVNAGRPAMLLVQAAGKHDLEVPGDFNAGDEGDPFSGTASVTR
jgi:immune inhibitor A